MFGLLEFHTILPIGTVLRDSETAYELEYKVTIKAKHTLMR